MGLHRIHLTNKPCPICGHVGSLYFANVFVMKAVGDYSIAGAQVKGVATERVLLACERCGLEKTGHLENAELSEDGTTFLSGHFVEDREE